MALTKVQKEGIETLINNNADNRVITGSGTANTLEGESSLTYDGTTLKAEAANPILELSGTAGTSGNTFMHINANANHWCVGADNYSSQNLFVIKDGTPASSTHRLAINSSGNVGIGTTSPSDILDVVHAANTASGISIRNTNNSQGSAFAQLLVSGGDNAKGRVKIETNGAFHTIDEDSNGNLILEDNGTERMRILAGGGLTFNGDTAAANALDDYEEGQYTPSVTGSTGQTDVSVYSAESKLNYTKIGNLVNISGRLRMETVSYSGGLVITLPFTAEASTNTSNASMAAVATHGADFDSSVGTGSHMGMFLEIGANSAYAYFVVTRDNSAWISANNSIITAGTYLAFTYTYRAA